MMKNDEEGKEVEAETERKEIGKQQKRKTEDMIKMIEKI